MIELRRVTSKRTGALVGEGSIRIDLSDKGYTGGYYERFDRYGNKISWGSLATMLGSELNWRRILSK